MASIFSLFLLFEILLFVFHNVYVAMCIRIRYNIFAVAPPAERR